METLSCKCDVPWCGAAAELVWYRTEAERKGMETRAKGATVPVQPERRVCRTHMPEWRADRYLPIGAERPLELVEPAKRRRKVAAPAPSPDAALLAALAYLAERIADPELAAYARAAAGGAGRGEVAA